MKIKEITLEGFGVFTKRFRAKFEEDKLNVILGPNESGKSTLLRGITAILFGLKKDEWKRYKSWGKAKNYIGEIKFVVDENNYRITREFETNKVTFIRQAKKGEITTLFEGNASPQSRTEEKEFYLSALKDVIGINNETVFYNTNVVRQKLIEAEIGSEIQQIITGAVGTNYKNILEKWRDRYFEYTKKSVWDDASDKRNDRKIELIEKQLKELEGKKENIIENSIKSSEIEEKLEKLEKELAAKEEELKKAKQNFETVKKYNELLEKYNLLKTRNKELTEEIERIKEINIELKSKEENLEEFKEYEKITDDVLENYRTLNNLKKELAEKEEKIKQLPSGESSLLLRKLILGINGFIIAGLTFLTGMKYKFPSLFIVSAGIVILTLGFIVYTFIRHSREKFKKETVLNLQRKEIEDLKRKILILNNTLTEHITFLEDESFEYKLEQYKKLSNEIENLKFTLEKMKDLEELKNSQAEIENEMFMLTKMFDEMESNNPFLSRFKQDPSKGIDYVNELETNIESLEKAIEELKSEIWETKKELASTYTESESIEMLDDRIEELKVELNNYILQKESYIVAVDALKEAILEYQEKHLDRLSRNVSEFFKKITKGRYIEINLTDEFEPVIKFKDSKIVNLGNLSCGAEEQLYFAIRLALIKEINNVTNLPLILDDSFVNFDNDRLKVVRDILYSIIPDNQVILLTHIQSYSGWKDINLIFLGAKESLYKDIIYNFFVIFI